jgi:signal transduction histidine kinase
LLTHLVEATSGRTTSRLRRSLHGERDLPQEVKIALYRIAQEALNNSVKYARASEIELTLAQDETGVKLTVIDNGRGFQVSPQENDHFGISIMRERAAEVGAQLEITSWPGAGTCVTCEWTG